MSKGIHRAKAPEAVKEKILDACAELLAKGQSPSIREVSQVAGVTTGAVALEARCLWPFKNRQWQI